MSIRLADYEYQPSFVLGFHGCDQRVLDALLSGKQQDLKKSENNHDWLGHGIYFWEGNPARALSWAQQRTKQSKIEQPAVVGAVIDLRRCLDLFNEDGLLQVQSAHRRLKQDFDQLKQSMPSNSGTTSDLLNRRLDCAVLNALHGYRDVDELEPYDSVRAPFLEGGDLYPTAGFRSQNHIQICVRDVSCIKGYFRPKTR